jgi:hypothetical protein
MILIKITTMMRTVIKMAKPARLGVQTGEA